jgi:hypothetical protein
VPVEAVFENAQRFYKDKSGVRYWIHLGTFQVRKEGAQIVASYVLSYDWENEDLGLAATDAERHHNIARRKSVGARAEVGFDSTFHIVSYTEQTTPLLQLTVSKLTWGTRSMSDAIESIAGGESAARVAKVKIPKGAALQDAFEFLERPGGRFGPDDRFQKVVFNGKVLWARTEWAGDDDHEGDVYIQFRNLTP